jgi:hypothetical protein
MNAKQAASAARWDVSGMMSPRLTGKEPCERAIAENARWYGSAARGSFRRNARWTLAALLDGSMTPG